MLNIPCEWKHGTARNCTGFIVDTNVNREGKIICAIILENGELVQAEWSDLRARRIHSPHKALFDLFNQTTPVFVETIPTAATAPDPMVETVTPEPPPAMMHAPEQPIPPVATAADPAVGGHVPAVESVGTAKAPKAARKSLLSKP